MKPRNAEHAADQARKVLKPVLTGLGSVAKREHDARAATIARAIFERWHVGPYGWKVKHLRWFLTYVGNVQSRSTRYRFWLTMRRLLVALGRERDWSAHLDGPWTKRVPPARRVRPNDWGHESSARASTNHRRNKMT
jgi:hypothetical protein